MIVQGTDFLADESGVGAVVVDKIQREDPMTSFYKVDNYFNQWKVRKDAQKTAERAQLANELKNYDFNTDKIDPLDVEYFKNGQQDIYKNAANLLSGNRNLNDPSYVKNHFDTKSQVGAMAVAANASAEQHNAKIAMIKEMATNPDKYDLEKSKQLLGEFNALPTQERLQKGVVNFLVPKGKDLNQHFQLIFDDKKNPLATPIENEVIQGGQKVKTKSLPLNKIEDILANQLTTNDDFTDKVFSEYDKLPPQVKDAYEKIAADPKRNPNGHGGAVIFATQLAKPYSYNNVISRDETDAAKKARDYKYFTMQEGYKQGKVEDSYKADVEHEIELATGYGAINDEAKKKLVQEEIMATPIGISEDKKPIYATDFEYVLGADGTLNYKFRPTSDFMGSVKGDEDAEQPFIVTPNFNVLRQFVRSERYKAKGEENVFNNQLQKRLSEYGAGMNNMRPALEGKIKEGTMKRFEKKVKKTAEPKAEKKAETKGNKVVGKKDNNL